MKNYIICLPDYPQSMSTAQIALASGQKYNWDIELFSGVDGLKQSIIDYGIVANCKDAKCRDAMKRPGVQGCLLSHWLLWTKCVQHNNVIGIFEHDVKFLKPFDQHVEFSDVLKLEGFDFKKPRPAGNWYEGTRGYLITPTGADKLLSWIDHNGCLPSDVQIGTDIVDIQLCKDQIIIQQDQKHSKQSKREQSFTWNLENIAL
jgi:GR25 family glycosyltransferase involved in LPS biosynthesis